MLAHLTIALVAIRPSEQVSTFERVVTTSLTVVATYASESVSSREGRIEPGGHTRIVDCVDATPVGIRSYCVRAACGHIIVQDQRDASTSGKATGETYEC